MTEEMVIYLARHTLVTSLLLVAPMLTAGLVVGLVVSIFQTITSIRESTLVIIPKMLAVVGVLIWLMPWMLQVMMEYTTEMIQWMRYFAQ